ncbi:protein with type I secretion target domain and SCP-like extracellular domain [Calothrix parasitica NIES-267]|uniref:Protein with type I secretion target domain and SCP-like extracellular domain n=1 Tax=Calothrix parasitica NIES-267 TaxID=1973488 RepID=A0A1Z4LZP9_9CYAN|nr:protein with type I secretion target domain and SCP-like extracellular domain [Calothrix parasitica NIES-267]
MAIFRVKASATGINDGSSWDNAFTSLKSALAIAVSGDEIWVAQGVYKPEANREDSFELPDGVTVYGGFAGDETNLEQRDIEKYVTYLSGDIGKERDNKDNNYTVVKLNNGTATLDGLIIQDGNSNNNGGGVYNDGNLTLKNVVVTFNLAADSGAGIFNSGTLTITDSTVADNFAIGNNSTSGGGGLINTSKSTATITNSIFSGNGANRGSAVRNDANLLLDNSTLIYNTAYGKGGGIANFGNADISNSIIAGNTNGDDFINSFESFTGTNISGGNNIIGNGEGISGFTDGNNGDKVGKKYNRIAVVLNEAFDNDSQFRKSTKFFSDGSDDYFGIYKQNATNIKSYTGFTNKFLTGQDLDGEGASLPITLTWSNLDIKWLTDLQFSADFASFFDSPGDIDDDDFIKVSYSIDDGQQQNLLWFSGSNFSNGSFNGVFSQDTNFDGVGDGQILSDEAQNFSTEIIGTGSKLDLTLEINLDSTKEDFAVDNFLITGITAPIEGTESKDSLRGTESHDQINGFGGNDYLKGKVGDDIIDGGADNDRLYGDDGKDTLTGGTGNDYLDGGSEEDSLEGGEGRDRLYGGDADDTLIGGGGNDYLNGGFGIDSLEGGEGNDRLYGGDLNDILIGGSGEDYISGGSGNDAITGVDIASSGVGEIDRLSGGDGEDTFILGNESRCFYDDGNNRNKGRSDYAFISDFDVNDDDIQLFAGEDYYLDVSRGSSNIYIDNDGVEGFSRNDELIGVIKGVVLTEGNIDGSVEGFNFV